MHVKTKFATTDDKGGHMHATKTIRALLIASVAVCAITSPIANIVATSAAAQAASLSAEFRTALEPYGAWQHHRRWGDVWIPSRVGRDWKPYTVGHWVYSQDYGWYWAPSEQEANWGLVTYHYGRWVADDEFGWMWIPGTEWGPGWVQWRHGRQYAGWAPLPPDEVMVEYRETPQVWVFVRERDLVAPRITEVILPPQEREVYFRDTAVVNRTVVLQDRQFAVNPGIPPTYIATAYGRPIPSYQVLPRVFAGTAKLPGAAVMRADDFRNRERIREIARESTSVRQTAVTVSPARELPPLEPLAANERGRLGAQPPRAAQPGSAIGQNRPEGPNVPGAAGGERPVGESPGRPAPSRQGTAPGQPLLQQGREGRPVTQDSRRGAELQGPGPAQDSSRNRGQRDRRDLREGRPATPDAPATPPGAQRNEGQRDVRGAQPGRDQRGLREGRPEAPPQNAPVTSGQGERRPQASAPGPSTSGAAPGSRERGGARELRNRPPEGPASPQEPRGRERPGIESQGSRSQTPRAERGATQRPAPAVPSQRPSAAERSPSPGVEAPRPRAPAAAERPRPPATTGAAPGGGGRREEPR
jgi:hypothetical protein